MITQFSHNAVLTGEAVQALNIRPDGIYVDATFGRGGHAEAILSVLDAAGRLIAMDRDPEAEHIAKQRFGSDARFSFERVRFGQLAQVMDRHGLAGKVHGLLLDLGVSSPQLDDPKRGFSFARPGPLDMRMDPECGRSAAQWLASATEEEISRVLCQLGEERFHRRVARFIVTARNAAPIDTTVHLAQIVADAVPTRERNKHPATRSFLAIRMFVNQELEELRSVLGQALEVLAPYGRIVVISFHSVEDRIVKRFLRKQVRALEPPLDLPVPADQCGGTLRVLGRPQRASQSEVAANPRARSAVLRVAERLP